MTDGQRQQLKHKPLRQGQQQLKKIEHIINKSNTIYNLQFYNYY